MDDRTIAKSVVNAIDSVYKEIPCYGTAAIKQTHEEVADILERRVRETISDYPHIDLKQYPGTPCQSLQKLRLEIVRAYPGIASGGRKTRRRRRSRRHLGRRL
jgi:hypothetical protein